MLVARRKSDQNLAAVDPWTAVHLAAGLAAGLVGTRFVPAMAVAVGYEVGEQVAESTGSGQRFFKTSGPESPANVVVDLLVFAVGWKLGKAWNES